MLNRIKNKEHKIQIILSVLAVMFFQFSAFAEDVAPDDQGQDVGAEAVSNYQVDGTMFQKITDFEQEKLLMQMDKERAQLSLDLDRLAAEKVKLQMDLDNMSGRAQEQQAKLEQEKQLLEQQKQDLEKQRAEIAAKSVTSNSVTSDTDVDKTSDEQPQIQQTELSKKYKLIEIIGAGSQLQATLEDLENGQKKKAVVGKEIDGYQIKSISLDDGIWFEKDGTKQILNIGK